MNKKNTKNYYYNKVKDNIDKFEIDEILSLKEICERLKLFMTYSTTTRKLIVTALESFFEIERIGSTKNSKYVFKAIRKEFAKVKKDNRGYCKQNVYSIDIANLSDEEDWNSKGVYSIILNEEVYVGQTNRSFRYRLREHYMNYANNSTNTQKMLRNNAEVKIVHKMNDIEDIELFLMLEKEIQEMCKELNYTLVKNTSK